MKLSKPMDFSIGSVLPVKRKSPSKASRSIGEFPFLIISLIPVMLKGNSDKEL